MKLYGKFIPKIHVSVFIIDWIVSPGKKMCKEFVNITFFGKKSFQLWLTQVSRWNYYSLWSDLYAILSEEQAIWERGRNWAHSLKTDNKTDLSSSSRKKQSKPPPSIFWESVAYWHLVLRCLSFRTTGNSF